jgi:hypothetical protein
MKNRAFFMSVIGYFIVTMVVAVIWHLVIFHDKYVEMGAFTRVEPIIPLGMVAVILQGCVFAHFYPVYLNFIGRGSTVFHGIAYSLIMGINVWTVMVFATAAKFKIEPVFDFIFLGTVFQLLQFVLVGVTLGILHKRIGMCSNE